MTWPRTLTQVIAALKDSEADIVLLGRTDTQVTAHAKLHGLILGAATNLQHNGVVRGDRVLVQLESDLDHIATFLGLAYIGAVPVSVKPPPPAGHPPGYLTEIADQQGARFAYGLKDIADCYRLPTGGHLNNDSVPPAAPESQDIAFVQYSSGSTGRPRPVAVRHGALCANLEAIAGFDGRSPQSVGFNCLPLHHDMGLVGGLLSCLAVPHSLLLSDVRVFLRRPLQCLEVAAQMGATVMAMPTFLLDYVARSLRRVRRPPNRDLFATYSTIYCGAEPIRHSTIQDFLTVGVPSGLSPEALTFCYGLAEATLLVTGHRFRSMAESFDTHFSLAPMACVGSPLGGTRVRVVPDTEAQGGGAGRIHIRGPSVFRGYEDEDDHSVEWFDTGDLGYLRDGQLFISGRGSESFVINGENLFAADIETHILESDGVEECVVLPDDNAFYIYVVTDRWVAPEPHALSARLAQTVGVAPLGIHYGSRAGIARTTSGKPVRHATLNRLKAMNGAWVS